MTLLIVFFFISIIFSFLCSIWEAVLLSITPSYVQIQLEKGHSYGKLLQKFKENIDRPLAAILTLNTIAHTGGAIGVGVQATKIWGESFMATFFTPVAMTMGILILSEIIPKTIGANFWRTLARFSIESINLIIFALYPLVWISQMITRMLKKDKQGSVLSRSDFATIAKIARNRGILLPGESKILENLMKLNSISAKDIMTPRIVVLAVKEDLTIQQFFDDHPNLRFSRIPIYTENKDSINGFFLKDDMLTMLVHKKGHLTLKEIKRELKVIPETQVLFKLFNQFLEDRIHIALIVDEFGSVSGIITMEDIIETLLGMEIVDEFDSIENMQAYARKKWENRARDLGILPDNKSTD